MRNLCSASDWPRQDPHCNLYDRLLRQNCKKRTRENTPALSRMMTVRPQTPPDIPMLLYNRLFSFSLNTSHQHEIKFIVRLRQDPEFGIVQRHALEQRISGFQRLRLQRHGIYRRKPLQCLRRIFFHYRLDTVQHFILNGVTSASTGQYKRRNQNSYSTHSYSLT